MSRTSKLSLWSACALVLYGGTGALLAAPPLDAAGNKPHGAVGAEKPGKARAGGPAAERSSPIDLRSRSPMEMRISAELQIPTESDFFDQPLNDVLQSMGDLHQIPIILERRALEDAGIVPSEIRVTLQVKDIALRSALNILLEPESLAYVIEDEVLKITTEEAASKKLDTRVYNVRRLAKAGYDAEALANAIQQTVEPRSWAGRAEATSGEPKRTSSGRGMLSGPVPAAGPGGGSLPAGATLPGFGGPAKVRRAPAAEQVGRGTVVSLPGALVVSQTQQVHREIAELLSQLERLAERRPVTP